MDKCLNVKFNALKTLVSNSSFFRELTVTSLQKMKEKSSDAVLQVEFEKCEKKLSRAISSLKREVEKLHIQHEAEQNSKEAPPSQDS